MRTRDYRDVVGEGPQFADDQRAYILQLGSVELEPIAYSTLLGLGDRPVVV